MKLGTCRRGKSEVNLLRLALATLITIGSCQLPSQPLPAASSVTVHLNEKVSMDLIALPGLHDIWMGRTPVTIGQFRAFVAATGYRTDAENPAGNGPGRVGGHGWDAEHHRFAGWFPQYTWRHTGWPLTDQQPVSNISWDDATAFCRWLSARLGIQVRLPTDDEFDRATHAGKAAVYFTGDSPDSLEGYANVADRSLCRVLGEPESSPGGFNFDDGYPFTSPVGSFKPNPWGFYDMLGNVDEWCSSTGVPKPCGCSYNDGPDMCREEARGRHAEPFSRYAYFGSRVLVEGQPVRR